MFNLVADVGRYGEFLPWVSGVRVKTNSETEMVADLLVGFKALKALRLEDMRTGRVRFLDALELEAIAWLSEERLSSLLDPSADRWRGES